MSPSAPAAARPRHAWLPRFRAPRRLHIRRSGAFLIAGTLALGLASLNTGNNLLYLLVGALLGTIVLSGWVSERALRGVRVQRRLPRALTVGVPGALEYVVQPGPQRLQSHGLSLAESGVDDWLDMEAAWLPLLSPGAGIRVRTAVTPRRRGVYALTEVTVATAFPFGLFSKERDVPAGGTVVVWPRTDLPVTLPARAGSDGRRETAAVPAAGGTRGEFRALREYRSGDDPRDVHWRSTARRGDVIVREYERDAADEYWLVLDTAAPDDEMGERAVDTVASLVAAAAARGDRFGLSAGSAHIPPGSGAARLDALLDVLATVRMGEPMGAPQQHPSRCVLVSAAAPPAGWGAVVRPVRRPTAADAVAP